jgi:Xaa-Pro dipeptidase
MEKAADATARGVDSAYEAAEEPGVTDSELAAAIGYGLRANADSSAAMDVIISTGRRGGVPHSSFRDVPLADGTTFIEFAGTHHRYHAPVMLTVARRLDDVARRLERLSQTILEVLLREITPGRRASDVAGAVKAELRLDRRDIFHFNFGYAIGLAHPPGWLDGAPFSIVAENEATLEPGMAFHIPASMRSFARCGVGLSHAIVLDTTGPRVLTGGEQPKIRVIGTNEP